MFVLYPKFYQIFLVKTPWVSTEKGDLIGELIDNFGNHFKEIEIGKGGINFPSDGKLYYYKIPMIDNEHAIAIKQKNGEVLCTKTMSKEEENVLVEYLVACNYSDAEPYNKY